jgi:hypothetical protein
MARRAPLLALALVAGCGGGGFRPVRDGGTADLVGVPMNNCTSTSDRAYQPLGAASPDSFQASFVWTGTSMGVAWEDERGSIYGATIDGVGMAADAHVIAAGSDPALLEVGGQIQLFWRDGNLLQHALLDGTLRIAGATTTVYQPTYDYFAVAWTGSGYGLVLSGAGGDMYQVYFLALDASGSAIGQPAKLPQGSNNSFFPTLAWDGARFVTVWGDTRTGVPEVYAAQLDATGAELTPETLVSGTQYEARFPALAPQLDGGAVICYELKVSPGNDEIACTRVDDTLAITNTQQLSFTAADSLSPEVYAHGKYAWVLWDDHPTMANSPTVQFQFLDQTGTPLLAQPRDTGIQGWRAHGAEQSGALYISEYHSSDGVSFIAEAAVFNCY